MAVEDLVGGCFLVHPYTYLYTLPETNIAPQKWMVGIRSFPFGKAYFQGRTVSFRECIYTVYFLVYTQKTRLHLSSGCWLGI